MRTTSSLFASSFKTNLIVKWFVVIGLFFLASSLFLLYLADAYSPLNPQGLLASEIYHYGNANARPNYDIHHRRLLFEVALLCVGFIAVLLRYSVLQVKTRTVIFRGSISYISGIILIAITAFYIHYSFPSSLYTQCVACVITLAYLTIHCTTSPFIRKLAYGFFYAVGALAFACVIWQLTHFGKIPYLHHSYDLFAADNHLTVLLSPAYRLAEGYTWFNGIQPTYTILLPLFIQPLLASSHFSLHAWFYLLETLQVIFIGLFMISALLQRRGAITFLFVCSTLTLFDPANVQLYFPNHFAWRFLDVPLVLFCLSLGCYFQIRLNTLLKSLIAGLAIFLNFETGVVLTLGLLGSEFLSANQAIQRLTKMILCIVLIVLLLFYSVMHTSFSSMGHALQFGKTVGTAMGGWRYFAIPAFVTVFMHSVIIIWRSAYSGTRSPRVDVRIVCAVFCVLWSMYFITRPDFVNFPSLLMVYAFLIEDLWSDTAWMMKQYRLLTMMTTGLLMLAYTSYPLSLLNPSQLVAIDSLVSTPSMQAITQSSTELKRIVQTGDAYITPFSFFTHALSGKSNHLSVADPFILIPLQSQQTAFLNGHFPSRIFIAKTELLFDAPTPVEYQALLVKIQNMLVYRHYQLTHRFHYWIEYEKINLAH